MKYCICLLLAIAVMLAALANAFTGPPTVGKYAGFILAGIVSWALLKNGKRR